MHTINDKEWILFHESLSVCFASKKAPVEDQWYITERCCSDIYTLYKTSFYPHQHNPSQMTWQPQVNIINVNSKTNKQFRVRNPIW